MLTIIGWTSIKFVTEIHVPLRMNCNHFGDSLTAKHNKQTTLISSNTAVPRCDPTEVLASLLTLVLFCDKCLKKYEWVLIAYCYP